MSSRFFAFVIGLGLFGMVFLPSAEKPQEVPSPPPAPRRHQVIAVPSGPQAIALVRSQNGHFFADLEVNGQTIHFLVDTGASSIALAADDARKLGFSWTDQELKPVGRGVSGPVNGKLVTLHHMRLGSRDVWDMEAAIIPAGLEVSLLGQSFLARLGSVSIDGDRMVLR